MDRCKEQQPLPIILINDVCAGGGRHHCMPCALLHTEHLAELFIQVFRLSQEAAAERSAVLQCPLGHGKLKSLWAKYYWPGTGAGKPCQNPKTPKPQRLVVMMHNERYRLPDPITSADGVARLWSCCEAHMSAHTPVCCCPCILITCTASTGGSRFTYPER